LERTCDCGGCLTSTHPEISCSRCGAPCCLSCAFGLGAESYCARCSEFVLDDEGIPLNLSAPAAWLWSRVTTEEPPRPEVPASRARWVILVARDQPELFEHLRSAFARDDKVEVVLDRRRDYSRNPPGLEDRLRSHGAAVVRRRS